VARGLSPWTAPRLQRCIRMKRARTLRLAHALPLAAAVLLLASGLALWSAGNADTAETTTALLDTGKTVLGQTFSYPTKAPAKVTSEIVAMAPGAETGWPSTTCRSLATCSRAS
jgi:hypothetical protein